VSFSFNALNPITRPSKTAPSSIVADASVTTQKPTRLGKLLSKSDEVTLSVSGTPSDISLRNLDQIADGVRKEHRLKGPIRVAQTPSEHGVDQVTFQAKGPGAADAIEGLQKTLQTRIEEAAKRQSESQRLNNILEEASGG
jgi:phosphotransferase system HPr-like phosphotransfer protein